MSLLPIPVPIKFAPPEIPAAPVTVNPLNVGESLALNPMSHLTSEVERLSNQAEVNLAYSSSATDALSILTAFVFEIPKVKDACAPMSDRTSLADLPST